MTQADMCASSVRNRASRAMMVAGSWLNTNIQNENPDLNYGVGYLPQLQKCRFSSHRWRENIMMMKDDNREASWELMKFPQQQREFQEIL